MPAPSPPLRQIEAIYDITKDLSLIGTDDEGRGAYLTLLHRHSGAAWKVQLTPPGGADPRLYGISGISPVDPSIKKEKVRAGEIGARAGYPVGAGLLVNAVKLTCKRDTDPRLSVGSWWEGTGVRERRRQLGRDR